MSRKPTDDPEVVLVAWKGRASALAARIGVPTDYLVQEASRLGACKNQGSVYLQVDLASAPGRLATMIERRRATLIE